MKGYHPLLLFNAREMNVFENIKEQWKGETPKIAKIIRNVCATISVSFPTMWVTFTTMNIEMPKFVSDAVGAVTLAALIITAIAGTKETDGAKSARLGKM